MVVDGEHTQATVSPDGEGKFRFTNLVREPLTMAVFRADEDGSLQFSSGPDDPGALEKRTVRVGDESITVKIP
ncbi:MAG: hypothetical protein V4671_14000 [Armatimonadota bacterium]